MQSPHSTCRATGESPSRKESAAYGRKGHEILLLGLSNTLINHLTSLYFKDSEDG